MRRALSVVLTIAVAAVAAGISYVLATPETFNAAPVAVAYLTLAGGVLALAQGFLPRSAKLVPVNAVTVGIARVLALAAFAISGLTAAPAAFGLTALQAAYLGLIGAVAGVVAGFLPAVQTPPARPVRPARKPPRALPAQAGEVA